MRIGIIGGGQLGKMIIDEAHKLGHSCIVLDPSANSCSKNVADKFIVGAYNNKECLKELKESSDVITYEFENINVEAIKFLEEIGATIPQGAMPLYISQNRIREKNAVKKLGINCTEFHEIDSKESLVKFSQEIGLPVILKTAMGGYDGKGQWIFKNIEEVKNFKISEELLEKKLILEKVVKLKKELSCVVIRNRKEQMVTFPVAENIHKNGILDISSVPAKVPDKIVEKIENMSKEIMLGLDFIGILSIEYFLSEEDEVYFNEMAPRPHNSCHYSMDACNASQFKMLIKSILNEDLEILVLKSACYMKNIMGEHKELINDIKENKNTKLHIYGKDKWIKDRKMGHINFLKLKELKKIKF